jgi:hypothetical protein
MREPERNAHSLAPTALLRSLLHRHGIDTMESAFFSLCGLTESDIPRIAEAS